MIFEINTAVPLVWTAGEDVGAATVVVVTPSGTVITVPGGPFSTGAPIGTYRAGTYTPTTAGRYTVTWTTASRVYTDIFDVRPAFRYALISVQDVKDYLRLKQNANDDTIAGFIEAASIAIKNITGPIIPEIFTEWYDGGKSRVCLERYPIIAGSVSVTEYNGTQAFVLTEQPLGAQTNAYGFTVDVTTGEVVRRALGGGESYFPPGAKNVQVTYTAGRAFVPENVRTATKELVRHLWSVTQVPGRRAMPQTGEDGYGWVPVGFAVPNFVVQLLQNDQRPPGMA